MHSRRIPRKAKGSEFLIRNLKIGDQIRTISPWEMDRFSSSPVEDSALPWVSIDWDYREAPAGECFVVVTDFFVGPLGVDMVLVQGVCGTEILLSNPKCNLIEKFEKCQ